MISQVERRAPRAPRPVESKANLVTLGLFLLAAMAAVNIQYPEPFARAPFRSFLGADVLPLIRTSPVAFGLSGTVRVRLALPGQKLEYPLDVHGDPANLAYSWTQVGDTALIAEPRPLAGADVLAPDSAGFYRLVLIRGSSRTVLEEMSVAVLVPFEEKVGGMVNGYRIGTYLAERIGGQQVPEGFLEITPAVLDLPVTRHLRVRDFVSGGRQQTWPRYAAVNPLLLDKIELVVAELARWHGSDSLEVRLHVTSGFRTPDHNRHVRRAAANSRHVYGEAVDLVIDADGDGRITAADMRLIGLAVEIVEMRHPQLAGGLGLYLRGRPHVHIDVGGRRSRWRG